MIVGRPTSEYDYNEQPMIGGHVATALHPWDWLPHITDELAEELRQQLAKKRPVGFAAWPEEGA